ncbi:adenylyl-sulfate kinase [Nitrosomonas sp.]|uniref:adenylyl-sulfate kinase n=1 Tax=Nitrosomonas sp. TaxID=42353 RepID=UPI0025DB9702|nr:adenylyl-sulfate kinase [Nitrosomonas sp.]
MNTPIETTTGYQSETANQFEAELTWAGKQPLMPGRQYRINLACREILATVTAIKYRIDVLTGAHLAARTLNINETGKVNLYTSEPLIFNRQSNKSDLKFVLTDGQTGEKVGAGTIDFVLRRATNIQWQNLAIDKNARSVQKQQAPKCIWFTGLSGSGKSTIANLLEKHLHQESKHTYLLDGDNIRHGLCRDLGFTEADRVENIRRVSEVARLMVDAGLIVLVSFISPFRSERRMARELFTVGEFVEIFIDTSLSECERRDVKGLYAKARSGKLKNFTGIDSPYEPPVSPEIHIQTTSLSPQAAVEKILKQL